MKRQILIVEDDESIYRSLAHMLDGDNYQLLWTQTGHEALRRSLDHSYDLLVLDLNVRDIDSSRALDWFGRLHPFLPVILLGTEQNRETSAGGAVLLRSLSKEQNFFRRLKTCWQNRIRNKCPE